jgi:hypothetical protein
MDLNDRRAVLLKPGDLLIIGNVGDLDPGALESMRVGLIELRESLDLAGIVIFEEDVDMTTIDAEQVEALMERQRERKAQRAVDRG